MYFIDANDIELKITHRDSRLVLVGFPSLLNCNTDLDPTGDGMPLIADTSGGHPTIQWRIGWESAAEAYIGRARVEFVSSRPTTNYEFIPPDSKLPEMGITQLSASAFDVRLDLKRDDARVEFTLTGQALANGAFPLYGKVILLPTRRRMPRRTSPLRPA